MAILSLTTPIPVSVVSITALSLTIDLVRGVGSVKYSMQDANGDDVGAPQILELPQIMVAQNMGALLYAVAASMQTLLGVSGTMAGAVAPPPPPPGPTGPSGPTGATGT